MPVSKQFVRQGALAASLALWLVGSLLDQLPALSSAPGSKGTDFSFLQPSPERWRLAQFTLSSSSDEEQLQELIRKEGPIRQRGAYAEAALLWEKIVEIVERTLGPDHPGTAKCINNLAELYRAQGRLSDAEPLYQRSIVIYEKTIGPEHPDIAAVLNNLAMVNQAQARYADAERLFIRSLSILEKAQGPQSTQIALNLDNLGSLYFKQARFKEAETLFKRALFIVQGLLGPEHPHTAKSLNNLAEIYRLQGHYGDAESLHKQALAILEKSLGAEHPDTAVSLNNLASLLEGQGRYIDAILLYKRSLAIFEKVLSPKHLLSVGTLNNLAALYQAQGNYGEAEQLYRRTIAIFEKALGPEHPDIATSLNNLAGIYKLQGRYGEAESLHKKALVIRVKSLGPEHPDTAGSLNNLATLYHNQHRFLEAESLHSRSLAIREKSLGPWHLDTAASLNGLAGVYYFKRRFLEAETLYKRSLAIREKALGLEGLEIANSLNNLAALYIDQGRSEEGEKLFQRAISISEKKVGPDHPYTVISRINLVVLYHLQKNNPAAETLLLRLNHYQAKWLMRELSLQPREQRNTLLDTQPDAPATTFALWDQYPSAAPLALETRLNRQGLLAEIERRQALLKASSPQTRQLAEQVAGIDRRLASVTLSQPQRESLRQQRQQLEAELYRLLPALKIDSVSNAQVAAALNAVAPQGLLVEFQKYRPYGKDANGKPRWGTDRYVALLLRPDGTIRAIPLGDAASIDEAVNAALRAVVKNEQRQPQVLAALSQRVFGPLQPHLAGVQVLFLSPDGELNRVPFAALPSPTDPARYLSEAFQLRILTTGRDLVRLQQPIQAAGGQSAGSNLLLADPDYGPPSTANSATANAFTFLPLPYTKAEAEQLKGPLRVPQPLTGKEATAGRVLRTRSPRILHIATHGIFQPDPTTTIGRRLKSRGAPDGSGMAPAQLSDTQLQLEGQDAMERIYLALAGANIPSAKPEDDGRLTAAEATGMDLAGTELVTLSACDTARGEIRSGEGVYGLQRALTVAGARSTLLSLWRVGDQRTAVFMAEFYKRLKAGQPRADALRDTQAFFRKHPDSTYRDVYTWGGFQLTGDWRPVEGL